MPAGREDPFAGFKAMQRERWGPVCADGGVHGAPEMERMKGFSMTSAPPSAGDFNRLGVGHLPGELGIVITHVDAWEVKSELTIRQALMAPNGYLHAGSVVSLADTSAGYGCIASLPRGATSFTTIELKCNHLATARDGTVECAARAAHLGRTSQVWDATVTHRESGKTLALFRCTQLILYPAHGPEK